MFTDHERPLGGTVPPVPSVADPEYETGSPTLYVRLGEGEEIVAVGRAATFPQVTRASAQSAWSAPFPSPASVTISSRSDRFVISTLTLTGAAAPRTIPLS